MARQKVFILGLIASIVFSATALAGAPSAAELKAKELRARSDQSTKAWIAAKEAERVRIVLNASTKHTQREVQQAAEKALADSKAASDAEAVAAQERQNAEAAKAAKEPKGREPKGVRDPVIKEPRVKEPTREPGTRMSSMDRH